MTAFLFPDTTVLINFALLNRLDLLESFLASRGRMVEAVAAEVRVSAGMTPNLAGLDLKVVFGDEIRIDVDGDIAAVEVVRTAVFGGRRNDPLRHLGESQTIHVLASKPEFSLSVMISDDQEAVRYAKTRGVITRGTVGIFETLVANGEIDAKGALRCCRELESQGRYLADAPNSESAFT